VTGMSDRKAELEKKKAKLQAIREQKERLHKEKEKKDVCYGLKSILNYSIINHTYCQINV